MKHKFVMLMGKAMGGGGGERRRWMVRLDDDSLWFIVLKEMNEDATGETTKQEDRKRERKR
ncbi:hypothetical protein WH47_12345 [Habropoda laboriosa]|uniref:Uncharacterized protein n=1 Tax=Habropoda laboriosa TaxID=597456 RepID=A0A0L7R7V9_9HYME|nr:hypothetical protein WH47_12345 [Habropoda laboriosa]